MPIGRYTRTPTVTDRALRAQRREKIRRDMSAKKKQQEAKRVAFEKQRQLSREDEDKGVRTPPRLTPQQGERKSSRSIRRQQNRDQYEERKRLIFDEEDEIIDRVIEEEKKSSDVESLRDILMESERFQQMGISPDIARHIASFNLSDNGVDSSVINEMVPEPRVGEPLLRSGARSGARSAPDQRNILGGMQSTRIVDDRDDLDIDSLMNEAKQAERDYDSLMDEYKQAERDYVRSTKAKAGRVQKVDKDLRQPIPRRNVPRPFGNTSSISGSVVNRPLQQAGGGLPRAYRDHLAPESQISQEALDREEYKGANPRGWTPDELRVIEQLRQEEYEDDAFRVRDIVDEVEILSGGPNDSLMDGQDLVDENKHETGDNPRGHASSGLDRGRKSHAVREIDLESIDSSVNDFFDGGEKGISDDVSSIGRRFGQAIPRVRSFADDDDDESVMSASDSIMSSITGLTDLSDKDGSWYSKDNDLEKDVDVNERMAVLNKIAINKDTHAEIGKFNPMMNTGNKLLMSQGASLGTISEMRKNEIAYKQPNRKYKGNAVNLVRMGNRTAQLLDNEYAP